MEDATRRELESQLVFLRKRVPLSEVTEAFLLDTIRGAHSKYDLYGATLLLRHFGTDQSVETLKECCYRPINDIQITALFALAKIAGPRLADFFEELLNSKQYRQKWAAMACLCEFGEARHQPSVMSRVKTSAKRTRACPEYGTLWGRETEVTAALKFVDRNQLYDAATIKAIQKIAHTGIGLTQAEQEALQRFLTSHDREADRAKGS